MPDITPIINSFNAGELSPLLDARTDLKKYYSGCRTLQNFITTLYGGAVRRPGTYYVAEVKDSSKETRLIPFEYNVAQAYILEFGNQYIRFYKNKGQIVYTDISFGANPSGDFAVGATMTGATSGATAIVEAKVSTQVYTIKYEQGTWTDDEIINCGGENVDCATGYPTTAASSDIAEITSPYLEADLFDLHFVQSADVLYIVDSEGGYQPRKLSRLTHDHWTLEAIDFEWGPFLDNNIEEITITPAVASDVTDGLEANATASSDFAAGYNATKAFDDVITGISGWLTESGHSSDEWIKIDLGGGNEQTVTQLRMQPTEYANESDRCPRYWKLQGSNVAAPDPGENHADWTKISASSWDAFCQAYDTDEIASDKIANYTDWVEVGFTNAVAYRHYRMWIHQNWGDSYTGIKEIELKASSDTYASDSPIFTSDHVGSIWKLAYPKTDNVQYDTCDAVGVIGSAIHLKNTCRFRTTAVGEATDQYVIKRKYDDDPDYHYFKKLQGGINYDLTWDEPVKEGADYIVELLAETAATDVAFVLSCEQNYDVCYIKIHTFTDSENVEATLIKGSAPPATATKLWAEGAWSDERGWPRTIGFLQGRIIYAGNTYNPLTLWFSETNNFEGMWAKTLAENENLDDDALIFTISAAQQNMIKWIMGQDALLVGTAGTEGKLASHNRSIPLTPDNIPEYRPQSSYGSGNIQPIMVNDVILFLQRENRKLREFKYSFNDNIFIAKDLTLFAEHITEGGLNSIARQQQPNSILWAVRGDGVLLGMTYERLEEIWAWHRHVLGGTDTEVKSVAVISAAGQTTNEDEVWLIVERTVNSNTVKYVEYMKPRNWGSTDTDVFFVDCGLSAAGSGGNTYIGGLDHLEGETVDILSDGKVFDEQVVGTGNVGTTGYVDLKVGGVATASTIKLHIGLPYTSDLQPMKLEIPLGQLGTARGRTKRIHEAVISFKDTLGGYFGRGVNNLDELNHAVTGTSGSMTSLKTEEETVTFPGDYETAGNVFIRQSYPLPMTIRSIVPKLKVSEI